MQLETLGLNLIRVVGALCLFGLGYLAIRGLNLNLPPSRNVQEMVLRVFWIFPADIPREKIFQNKVAWFAVYLIVCFIMLVVLF